MTNQKRKKKRATWKFVGHKVKVRVYPNTWSSAVENANLDRAFERDSTRLCDYTSIPPISLSLPSTHRFVKDIAVVAGLLVVESGETRTRRCVYNTHLKKDEIIFFLFFF